VGKNKLSKFRELENLDRVFQPEFSEVFQKDYHLKGQWGRKVFNNSNPIVLELGCGKGEYTVGLAGKFKDKNFIGVDIKGARIWKGAKTAHENEIRNAAFLRTRIEFINSFFDKDEVDEIWLTFPDPQEKKRRKKKRLTSPVFLKRYQDFLRNEGIVHLKTDNSILFDYTEKLALFNQLQISIVTRDLYNSGLAEDILQIKTFYESQYLEQGIPIKYIQFLLPSQSPIHEMPDPDEE